MSINTQPLTHIVFDYGNTLIEFSQRQADACDDALATALAKLYDPPDRKRLLEIRRAQRLAPFQGDPPTYKENSLRGICADLVRELYNAEPTRQKLDVLVQVRFDAFLQAVEAPDYLHDFLARMQSRYRLALLSNYPDNRAVRASLEHLKVHRYFDAVVVSADLGVAKPHPRMFSTITSLLEIEPSQALYVGDNWIADVQGAKFAGMQMAHITQYESYEKFRPREGDLLPDAVIGHLLELEDLLK